MSIWTVIRQRVTLDINNILLNAHCFPNTVISRNRKILKFENWGGGGGGGEGGEWGKVCAK